MQKSDSYYVCSDIRLDNLCAIWIAEIVDNKVKLWHIYPNNSNLATKKV